MMKKKNRKKFKINRIVAGVEAVVILFTLILGAVYYRYTYNTKKSQVEKDFNSYIEELSSVDLWKKCENKVNYIDANEGIIQEIRKYLYPGSNECSFPIYEDDFDVLKYDYENDVWELTYPFAMKYEFFDKDGNLLLSSNDEYLDVLCFYKEDETEEITNSYILRSSFTKEQLEEAEIFFSKLYKPEVGVEKIQGYYENDSFVLAGITLYAESHGGEFLKDYELVNDELVKKASGKLEVVYSSEYADKYNPVETEGEIRKTDMELKDYLYAGPFGDKTIWGTGNECDELWGFYDRDVLKNAEKIYSEKTVDLENEGDISYEYINEENNLIGVYGVIGSKTNPEPGDIASVRFIMCMDIDKYISFPGALIHRFVFTFILMQLLAIFAIWIINRYKTQAKKAKTARNVLISAMAQEMRTPAEIITTCAEKIDGTSDEEVIKENENIICEAAEYISVLVSHMLSYTRKAGVGYELKISRTPLDSIIDNACKRLSIIAEKRNITIETDGAKTCMIDADARLLAIVVDDYITNAIALCKDGGKVKVKKRAYGMEVSYNGRVLGKSDRKNLWKPLKKMDNYWNGKKVSEVSGLYLSSEILKLHGLDYGIYLTKDGMCLYFDKNINNFYKRG